MEECKPEWDVWSRLVVAKLDDLCWLAGGLCRNKYSWWTEYYDKGIQQNDTGSDVVRENLWGFLEKHRESVVRIEKIKRIAFNHLASGSLKQSSYAVEKHFMYEKPVTTPMVKIAEFREWALSVRIDLPEDFPKEVPKRKRADSSSAEPQIRIKDDFTLKRKGDSVQELYEWANEFKKEHERYPTLKEYSSGVSRRTCTGDAYRKTYNTVFIVT